MAGEEPVARTQRLGSLCIQLMDGNAFTIPRGRDMTVNDLVTIISQQSGKERGHFVLFHNGARMRSGMGILDYEIDLHDFVQVIDKSYISEDGEMWKKLVHFVDYAIRLCRRDRTMDAWPRIAECLTYFLIEVGRDMADTNLVSRRFTVFRFLSIPKWLCSMYTSNFTYVEGLGYTLINRIHQAATSRFLPPLQVHATELILHLTLLLDGSDRPLYYTCRTTLCEQLDHVFLLPPNHIVRRSFTAENLLPLVLSFVRQFLVITSPGAEFSFQDVRHCCSMVEVLPQTFPLEANLQPPVPIPINPNTGPLTTHLESLHQLILTLFGRMQSSLERAAAHPQMHESRPKDYLMLLKSLHLLYKLFEGGFNRMTAMLQVRRVELNKLIKTTLITIANAAVFHVWLVDYKDLLDFETTSLLGLNLFQRHFDDGDVGVNELVIDRTNLVESSAARVIGMDPFTVEYGVRIRFLNEEGIGRGILREWMKLVFDNIVSDTRIFITNRQDQSKIYINPDVNLDDEQGDILNRSYLFGHMIALSIMHGVRVGVFFTKIFYKQFAGSEIQLLDIRDADPDYHRSLETLLRMEPAEYRSVVLGSDPSDTDDDDKSVLEYVTSHALTRFNSVYISQVIDRMSQGFSRIIGSPKSMSLFFRFVSYDDFNHMVGGEKENLSVEEWKGHTDYKDFDNTDQLVIWFWEIVQGMSPEQRRQLLFFWTSTKFLPRGGFPGVPRLQIVLDVSADREAFPRSQTCFSQLKLPAYETFEMMKEKLSIVFEEDLGFAMA